MTPAMSCQASWLRLAGNEVPKASSVNRNANQSYERSIPAGQSLLELSKPTVAGSKGSDISAELARWKVEQPTWDGTQ